MNLAERLQALAAALPSDAAAVSLTRADLLALLDGAGEALVERDLTVEEVAGEVGRAPSTVRGWLIAGELTGYKLNARDWRVPRAALRDYLGRQREEPQVQTEDAASVDISAWRRVAR